MSDRPSDTETLSPPMPRAGQRQGHFAALWCRGARQQRAIATFAALVLVTVSASCGSNSTANSSSNTPLTAHQVVATPTPSLVSKPTTPASTPTITGTPRPTVASTPDHLVLARQVFHDWYQSEACPPATASRPEAVWCAHFSEVSFSGNTLTATSTLKQTDTTDVKQMCDALTVFVTSKVYANLGVTTAKAFSDPGGERLC